MKKVFKLLVGNSDELSVDHSQARGYSLRCPHLCLSLLPCALYREACWTHCSAFAHACIADVFSEAGGLEPRAQLQVQMHLCCTSAVLHPTVHKPIPSPAFGPLLFFEQSSSLLSLACSSCLHYPLILLHDQEVF